MFDDTETDQGEAPLLRSYYTVKQGLIPKKDSTLGSNWRIRI